MSTPLVKAIHLQTTYSGDLSRIKDDIATLKGVRRQLEKSAIRIKVRLDLSGITTDAAKAANIYQRELRKSMNAVRPPSPGGGSTSAGGIFIPAGAMQELKQYRQATGKELKSIETTYEGSKARILKTVEQLQQGISRLTTESTDRKGKVSRSTTITDTRPLENFKRALDEIDKTYGHQIGAAKGSKGDVANVLAQKKTAIDTALSQFANLEGSSEYQRARRSLVRLDQTLSQTGASQKLTSDKATKNQEIEKLRTSLDQIDRDFASRIGQTTGSKGDVASVLRDKRQRIEAEMQAFGNLKGTTEYRRASKMLTNLEKSGEQSSASQTRASAAEQERKRIKAEAEAKRGYKTFAERTIHNDDRRLQSKIKENKADESAAKSIQDRTVRESELNRVLDAREKLISNQQQRYQELHRQAKAGGHGDAANQFTNAASRMGNDLGQIRLDRTRAAHAGATAASDRALEQQINQAMRQNQLQRANLVLEEKAARMVQNRRAREAQINDILARRASLLQGTRNTIADAHAQASTRGNQAIMGKAERAGSTLALQGSRDMDRLASATTRSTHANNFHSSSLVKNAVSFTRWTLAMTAVTAPVAAIGSGIANAVKLERTFKTLNATFRGSREDAKLLAQETLALAAANGRDGQEAAEAAVAWSRLGLTRTQVLLAVETSLRAANVAEISAAEATSYLTAAYKNFHLTILDIPATLDYLNSLSNSNADKVKDMFNSIARGGKVAQQAGLSLREFAAISATVGEATQRPGAEFGNASKAIFNRIRKPETMEKLKSEFDLDFSTPTGDVQKMGDILSKLAEIYPTLNAAEKNRLTILIAGSNQSNRAAVMLETYTDALIAQSIASADSNSAMRENAEILNSVDAGLQMVATSWNALILSLAEMGAFQAISKLLQGLTSDLTLISKLIDKANAGTKEDGNKGPAKSYKLQDRAARLATATAERGINAVIPGMDEGDPTAPTKKELEWLLNHLKGKGRASSLKQYLDVKNMGGDEKSSMIAEIEAALAKGPTIDLPSAGSPAGKVLDAQRKIESLGAGAKAFQALSRDVFSKDPKNVLSSFDEAVPILKQLPGGDKEMLDAKTLIRPLLEKGDRTGASNALREFAEKLTGEGKREYKELEAVRPEMVAKASGEMEVNRQRLTDLDRQMAAAAGNPSGQRKIQSEIDRTTDLLKSQQDAYDVLTRKQAEAGEQDPFEEMRTNLNTYLSDMKIVGEVFGDLMKGFANTGFADLDAKLRIGAARMEGDLFEDALDRTREENGGKAEAAQRELDVFANKAPHEFLTPEMTAEADAKRVQQLQEELNQYGMIDAALTQQIEKIREATREEEKKLEVARQAARIQEAYDDGSAFANSSSKRFAIGRSEGEQIVNQTAGTMSDLRRSLAQPTAEDPLAAGRQLGELTERLRGSKEGILSVEDRMNRAIADRANLEHEISEQAVKQREEATKRLALASREDQLRAAAAKAFLRTSGKSTFSMQEFQYFSQETRGALSNLSPTSVRGLDDTERDNNEARGNLDTEIKLLSTSLVTLRKTFDELRPRAENKGGRIGENIRPDAPTPDVTKDKTNLNLNIGGINITLDMDKHIQTIVQQVKAPFQGMLNTAMQNLKRELTQNGPPNTAPAAGTY